MLRWSHRYLWCSELIHFIIYHILLCDNMLWHCMLISLPLLCSCFQMGKAELLNSTQMTLREKNWDILGALPGKSLWHLSANIKKKKYWHLLRIYSPRTITGGRTSLVLGMGTLVPTDWSSSSKIRERETAPEVYAGIDFWFPSADFWFPSAFPMAIHNSSQV